MLAAADGEIKLFDVAVRQPIAAALSGKLAALAAFSPDGRYVASAWQDRLTLWDAADGTPRWQTERTSPHWAQSITALAFAPDGAAVHTDSAGGERHADVRVWDVSSPRPRSILEAQNYSFLVRSLKGHGENTTLGQFPFQQVREPNGRAVLSIVRNGASLQRHEVLVPSGPLRLSATREGDKLTFRVNDLPPLVYQDLFQLGGNDAGLFGLLWHTNVRLERLAAHRQPRPAAASPVERGDDLFARAQYEKALAAYDELAAFPGDVGAEARYKRGLCRVALNQPDQAVTAFEPLAAEPGERWPLLAACQLWLLHNHHNRSEQADAVLDVIVARADSRELVAIIPDHLRATIVFGWSGFSTGRLPYLLHVPRLRQNSERAVRIADVFLADPYSRVVMRNSLLNACWAEGDTDKARRVGEEVAQILGTGNMQGTIHLLRPYCWLLARSGEAQRALEILDKGLYNPPGVVDPTLYGGDVQSALLLRAQLHAALNKWDDAEKDLAEFFRDYAARPTRYHIFGPACLMQGFLLDRRGDAAGAEAAWRKGLVKAWRHTVPRDFGDEMSGAAGIGPLVPDVIMASLVNDFTEADLDTLLAAVKASLGTESAFGRAVTLYRPPAAAVRQAFRTPRGREAARRHAFALASLTEWLRLPGNALGVQLLVDGSLPGGASAEQEALLWQLADDATAHFSQGRFGKTDLLQLGLAWKGQAGTFGWGGVQKSLPVQLLRPRLPLYSRAPHPPAEGRGDAPADGPCRFEAGLAAAQAGPGGAGPAEGQVGAASRAALRALRTAAKSPSL